MSDKDKIEELIKKLNEARMNHHDAHCNASRDSYRYSKGSGCSCGNQRDRDRIRELEEVIRGFLDCPRQVDEATVPKGGVRVAPEQVVFNASIGLVKIDKAREVLGLKELGIP
jgi:hypothetical protein